jgi:cobaltochelatase CobN
MHLLAATPGAVDDGSEAVDLGQTPGDIVVLSAADTEIACLATAQDARRSADGTTPSVRLANYLRLGHNLSVDLYVDRVITDARLVIVRLLGGRGYWTYGVDEIAAACAAANIPVAFLPGDDQPDAELARLTTLDEACAHRLWQYLIQGGTANAENFLAFAATLTGHDTEWSEPAPLLRAGLYWPGTPTPTLSDLQRDWRPEAPVATIVFYRALVQAANLAVIDGLIAQLQNAGLNPLPVYASSLKDPIAAATL